METPNLYIHLNDYVSKQTHPAPLSDPDEAVFSCNFDYEILSDGTKRVYIDVGLRMNYVEILYRMSIEFDGNVIDWPDVFSTDIINPLVDNTLVCTTQGYFDYCEENNIPYCYIEIDAPLIDSFTKNIIDQYVNYRSQDDISNAFLLYSPGLECETGTETILVFQCTFAIIDQLLFDNLAFNNARNRATFSDTIPMPRYLTIRDNCAFIDIQNVDLNFLDTIILIECIDCALQMLVGDKSDIIKDALKDKDINSKKIRSFIKIASKHLALLRESYKSKEIRIINLENLPDWNRLFH